MSEGYCINKNSRISDTTWVVESTDLQGQNPEYCSVGVWRVPAEHEMGDYVRKGAMLHKLPASGQYSKRYGRSCALPLWKVRNAPRTQSPPPYLGRHSLFELNRGDVFAVDQYDSRCHSYAADLNDQLWEVLHINRRFAMVCLVNPDPIERIIYFVPNYLSQGGDIIVEKATSGPLLKRTKMERLQQWLGWIRRLASLRA